MGSRNWDYGSLSGSRNWHYGQEELYEQKSGLMFLGHPVCEDYLNPLNRPWHPILKYVRVAKTKPERKASLPNGVFEVESSVGRRWKAFEMEYLQAFIYMKYYKYWVQYIKCGERLKNLDLRSRVHIYTLFFRTHL